MHKNHQYKKYKYCPVCGTEYKEDSLIGEELFYKCPKCNFYFFMNSSPAVSAVIPKKGDPDKLLMATRVQEPGAGKIDFLGGFVGYHETIEDAVKREVKEEVGIDVEVDHILDSEPQEYEYGIGVNSVLNIHVITKPIDNIPENLNLDEVKNCVFYHKDELVDMKEKFAFESDIIFLKKYFNLK